MVMTLGWEWSPVLMNLYRCQSSYFCIIIVNLLLEVIIQGKPEQAKKCCKGLFSSVRQGQDRCVQVPLF